MMQKIQWFVDLETSKDTMQIVKITAGGDYIMKRTAPFWSAFKYFKLGPVKLRFVPASTLPVDPTGLSYETGAQYVNPADMFNPGLVRITNGEDFFNDAYLPSLTEEEADAMYQAMMLDKRWYKFQLQKGFKRTASPRFWSVAQVHQDAFPGWVHSAPNVAGEEGSQVVEGSQRLFVGNGVVGSDATVPNVSPGLAQFAFYQTGMKERMGWLPTDSLVREYPIDAVATEAMDHPYINTPPEIELMKIILPRAHNTKFFYRVYVEETVYFKDPVTVGFGLYAPMDRFIRPNIGTYTPNKQMDLPTGQYLYPGGVDNGNLR